LLIIGNQDAVWGFALAGAQGRIVESADGLNRALDEALASGEYGIILITDDVAGLARDRVDELVMRSAAPLVVEIPGPRGPRPDRPPLSEVLRRTLGVKI
jgi:V/A-type H+-transporting ATPase subunit F